MEKSVSSLTCPGDPEIPGSEINSYIQQLLTLRKSIEKSNNQKQYWETQKSKLLESNDNIKMNFDKLSQHMSDIEAKISENTRIHIAKKQEMKDLQNSRSPLSDKFLKTYESFSAEEITFESSNFRNDCLSGIGNYADNFSQWITTYSRHVLMKDIESNQKECRKIGAELAILKEEVNSMKRDCDLEYVETNVEDKDLSNLNKIISDVRSFNSNLRRKIKLEEDTLNMMQDKIKRSKIALDESKTKERLICSKHV